MDGAELRYKDLFLVQVLPLVPLRFLFRHEYFFKIIQWIMYNTVYNIHRRYSWKQALKTAGILGRIPCKYRLNVKNVANKNSLKRSRKKIKRTIER
jgi:hypothetical protein